PRRQHLLLPGKEAPAHERADRPPPLLALGRDREIHARYGSLRARDPSGAPAEASLPTEEPNYLAHAFKSQYNVIGLGTALGFAVLSGTLLPIVVAAGVEMIV